MQAGIAEEAAKDVKLFQSILAHRMFFFKQNWLDYSTISPGTIRLVPLPEHMSDWHSDYTDMVKEMFYGDAPTFEQVIDAAQQFQENFNRSAGN